MRTRTRSIDELIAARHNLNARLRQSRRQELLEVLDRIGALRRSTFGIDQDGDHSLYTAFLAGARTPVVHAVRRDLAKRREGSPCWHRPFASLRGSMLVV